MKSRKLLIVPTILIVLLVSEGSMAHGGGGGHGGGFGGGHGGGFGGGHGWGGYGGGHGWGGQEAVLVVVTGGVDTEAVLVADMEGAIGVDTEVVSEGVMLEDTVIMAMAMVWGWV